MKRLLLLTVVLALAPTSALAQRDSVTVQVAPGETCPVGWASVDTPSTQAARIYYVLPDALAVAYQRTHIRGTPEFQVTQAFVTAVWPTLTQQQAAYASGRLRSEPATSGTVRSCTLP